MQKRDFSQGGKASKMSAIPRVILIVLVCAFSIAQLPAQSAAQSNLGSSLEAEIQNIEKSINRQGITPAEKHDALVNLARLRQLSGDIEGAAKNWLEAAAAIPGQVDDEALLSCAFCLAAMGEWDRAATALEPIVSKLPRARFLDLSIKAIRTGDTSQLAAIVDHPNYYEVKTEILFVLWKVSRGSSGERWRQRLITEYPQTPEGQLASGLSASSISMKPSPFWLFAGGLDSLPLAESKPAGRPAPNAPPSAAQLPKQTTTQPTTSTQPQRTAPTVTIAQAIPEDQSAPAPKSAASASQAQTSQQSSSSSGKLQTGVFSRQENAQAQTEKLKGAGFSPTIERRIVNNSEMWAVTVPAGNNQTQTVNALRAAGFDSFPVK